MSLPRLCGAAAPRGLVFALLLTVAALVAVSSRPARSMQFLEESPMFRGNPAHTGVMGTGPREQLTEKWRFSAGAPVLSSPAVVDGIVYVGSGGFKGEGRTLFALDAETGVERWRFETQGAIWSSPAVVDNRVFFGSDDGNLYALDARDGTLLWRFQTGGEVSAAPVVDRGTVYVGSFDGFLYALDAATGSERWRFQTFGQIFSSPAVARDIVYVGSKDATLYAVAAESGQEQWQFRTGGEIFSSPAVLGDNVFIGSNDGILYAIQEGPNGGGENGRIRTGGRVFSSPAALGRFVYVGTFDGALIAFDVAEDREPWRFATGDWVTSSPAISGDGKTIYVGSQDHSLYAVDLATGTEIGNFPTGDVVYSSPAVVNGVIYVGSQDGFVYAVAAPGGALSASARDWVGGWFQGNGEWYGRPWVALYGANSDFPRASVTFDLDAAPPSGATLTLVGLDDELTAKVDLRIDINGVEIFNDASPFPNWDGQGQGENAAWTAIEFPVPAGILAAGPNQITVRNLEPDANFGVPPWVLLSDASLRLAPSR